MQLPILSLLLALLALSERSAASPASRLDAGARRARLTARHERAALAKREMTTVTTTKLMTTTVAATTATVTKTVLVQVAAASSSTTSKATTVSSTSKPAAVSSTTTSKAATVSSTSKAATVNSTSKPATVSVTASSTKATAIVSASSTKASSSAAATTSAAPYYNPSYAQSQVNVPLTAPPASIGAKQVFAHHMVGNTYSYTQSTWADDISLALGAGIDAFALNTGSDYWQSARIADAYAAAKGTSFKMFMSLDMTSLGCANEADAVNLRNYVTTYAKHPNQATYKGKQIVSTFSGEWCTFGESSTQLGWQKHFLLPLAAANVTITFLPSIFSDPSTFSTSTWFDGILNWNSGWPMGATNLDTSSDQQYMSALGNKTYMAAVSPGFFTYYSPSSWNKDWIYRGDNWLYASRWEDIIKMRNDFDMVEILTWNDYGESSYIGPIRADQPNSQAWVNNFPHQAYLDMTKFYATAYKTGKWPAVTANKMFVWSRPHPKAANAVAPSMARPTRWQDTDDNLYALVMSTQSGKVYLSTGNRRQAFYVNAGITRLSMTSYPGTVGIALARGDGTMVSNVTWPASEFTYTLTPQDYNFNYWVGSS